MLPLLPKEIYQNSTVMREHLEATTHLTQEIKENADEVQNGYYITITNKFEDWELDVGLNPDSTLEESVRRSRIIGRLRAVPNTTISKVVNIAMSFFNNEVSVEVVELHPFGVRIEIIGTQPTLEVLKLMNEAIQEMLPAHLIFSIQTTFKPTSANWLENTGALYTVYRMPMTQDDWESPIMTGYSQDGYTVTTDYEYSATYAAWKIFDYTTARWRGYAGDWVCLECPEPVAVNKISFTNGYTTASYSITNFVIEASNDGQNWVQKAAVSPLAGSYPTTEVDIPNAEKYLYWRIRIISTSSSYGYIRHLSYYGYI